MLGLAFGTTVVLISIAGFVKYAVATPGVQTWAFLWGFANGMALCRILSRLAGDPQHTLENANLGSWVLAVVDTIITPPIQAPDGWPQWLETWGSWLLAGLIVWCFMAYVLDMHPRKYVAFKGGGGKSGGRGGRMGGGI